jgi:two-component system, OmpR family, response regulator
MPPVPRWRTDSAKMDDKVNALDSGADDFLVRPISSREFLGRIGAVLRSHPSDWDEEIQTLGALSLYRGTMEVCVGAKRKKLTPKEFELLGYLMGNPGRVFSRETCWRSPGFPGRSRTVVSSMSVSQEFAKRSKKTLPNLALCLLEEVKAISWLIP